MQKVVGSNPISRLAVSNPLHPALLSTTAGLEAATVAFLLSEILRVLIEYPGQPPGALRLDDSDGDSLLASKRD
jgi:hypothetical protein